MRKRGNDYLELANPGFYNISNSDAYSTSFGRFIKGGVKMDVKMSKMSGEVKQSFFEDVHIDLKKFNLFTSEDKLVSRLIKTSVFEKKFSTDIIVTHWLEEFFILESGVFQKLYEAKGGWLILDRSIDACVRFDRQEEFFDNFMKTAREWDVNVIICTDNIDVIKNFCKSILKTDHNDGAFFRIGFSARTSEEGKIIATEYTPEQIMNLIALGVEIR